MTLTRDSLLLFLERQLGVDTNGVDEDTPLFSSGLIDSAGMVDLIVHVETEAKIRLAPDDVTLDNLDSIGRILRCAAGRHGS